MLSYLSHIGFYSTIFMQDTDLLESIEAIRDFRQKAYALYSEESYDQALRMFYHAWLQIPKPQVEHPQAATVLSGIGDCYYKMRKYKLAIEALRSALTCTRTDEQSLILLRMGQSLFNSGQKDQAVTYLKRAHSLDPQCFMGEHTKYLNAIKDLII